MRPNPTPTLNNPILIFFMELTEEQAPELRVVRHEMYWDPYLQSPLSHSNNFEYDEDEVDDSADKEDSGGNAERVALQLGHGGGFHGRRCGADRRIRNIHTTCTSTTGIPNCTQV